MSFHDDALTALETDYDQLQRALLKAAANGATAAQLEQLRQLSSSAGDAYWRGVASELGDDNPVVMGIFTDLKAVNGRVEAMLADLKDTVKLINAATEAVKLAGSLVTLAAVV